MSGKVNIEVMIDTNANSRRIDKQYDGIRDVAEGTESDAANVQALREFRDYLGKAGQRSRTRFEVTQRDTAQIFHEKTNLMTPELAAQAGYEIRPDFVRENLEQGHYHVEPPIHGEDRYYDALETFLRKILPEKHPVDLPRLDAMTADTRGLVLQDMYLDHMVGLPTTFREGKFAADFAEYRETRFNAGEETAINFLRDHPLPPEGERTAFVFVGSDKWANSEMGKARAGKDDEGRFEVFVVSPKKFRGLMEQVIRDVEREQPEMRELRKSYRQLSQLQAPDAKAAARGRVATDPEAQAFAGFVTRLMQEEPQERER